MWRDDYRISRIKTIVFSAFLFGGLVGCIGTFFRRVSEEKNVVMLSAAELRKRYPNIALLSLIPDMHLDSGGKGSYYASYYAGGAKDR